MTKQTIKIYLESDDYKHLLAKAEALGFTGRGGVSHYIEKVSREPIVFLDDNTRELLKALNLNSNSK